ncbi:hypothetical protein AN944_00058 [Shewanella sp. P1-14-1]|nr:hypothetical protein AN944_00058 [Shewanella sp. P1-14-1]
MRKKHISAYQSIGGKSARVKSNRRKHTLLIPKVFTLYNAPENVLMITKEVADLINHKHINHLHIDHRKCEQHDLSAELLLANAVRSLDALKTKNGARFKISGNFPENEKMKRLLSSIGVVKETAAKRYHLNNKNDLKLYKKISDPNEKESLFSNNRKKDATTEFVPYIDDCLSFINARMDREESTKLNHYLGEVLGNAEEHSGEKLWTLLGYLDAKNPDDLYCEIVILNIGKTIYQTFDEKRNVEIVNGSWQSYLAKHLGKLNEEQLTLVHSMQQNISSKLDEQIDRGQGSKHLINLFHHLTEECNRLNLENNVTSSSKPQMLILSGGAMLKFDGTYKPSEDSKGLMRFALNSENSIEIEPDECYIPSLRHGVAFPGTTIYIRFSLQQSELVSL